MRKLLLLIIVAVAFTFTIDSFYDGAGDNKDEVEVLRDVIACAEMKSFTDSLYGYTVYYPNFFQVADDNQEGCNHFCYHGRTNIIIETKVTESLDEWKSHAGKISRNNNAIIMDGDYYEEDNSFENMRFHTKAILSAKRWRTYTVVYDKRFERSMQRIIKAIDEWK